MNATECNCYFPGDCDGSCTHPKPAACEACDGSGVEVFGVWVYEPGCGFGHDSTDERPCSECDGTGNARSAPRPILNHSTQRIVPDDDLPF